MQKQSKKKVRAILVGGLVVGIGAAVTLAAWNDSEFAQGTFEAGQFNLEGSTTLGLDGFEEHPTGTPAALGFTVNPTNLAPGDVVYAPFAVRLDDVTTNDASVVITASGGATTGLSYELVQTTEFGCASDATPEGADLVTTGTALGSVAGTAAFSLSQGTAGDAGEAVNLCFVVTADSDLDQGTTGTGTWEFAATSKAS